MAKRSVWQTLESAVFFVVMLGLAAVAILSGAFDKRDAKSKKDKGAEIGVTIRTPQPEYAPPPTIPDAKHYPL